MEKPWPTEYCNLFKLNPSEKKVVLFIIPCEDFLKNLFFFSF